MVPNAEGRVTIDEFFAGLGKFKNDHLVGANLLNPQTLLSTSTCPAQRTVLMLKLFSLTSLRLSFCRFVLSTLLARSLVCVTASNRRKEGKRRDDGNCTKGQLQYPTISSRCRVGIWRNLWRPGRFPRLTKHNFLVHHHGRSTLWFKTSEQA